MSEQDNTSLRGRAAVVTGRAGTLLAVVLVIGGVLSLGAAAYVPPMSLGLKMAGLLFVLAAACWAAGRAVAWMLSRP